MAARLDRGSSHFVLVSSDLDDATAENSSPTPQGRGDSFGCARDLRFAVDNSCRTDPFVSMNSVALIMRTFEIAVNRLVKSFNNSGLHTIIVRVFQYDLSSNSCICSQVSDFRA